MTVLAIASFCLGIIGIVFGLICYWHLWRWARQCQGARIAVSYKRKVKLHAPLVEWLLWCNQLDKDKDSHGRVVYTMGGTTIAITKRVKAKRRSRRKQVPQGQPPVREGSWAATDETGRE